jgi:hypothetical protein
MSELRTRLIKAVVASFTTVLTACTTPQPEPEPVVRKAEEVTAVQVHSLPPGCFVELNGEFLGATPLTIRVPSYEGDWQGGGWKMYVLRASIPRGQGYEQKLWFGGDPVPKRIIFRIPGAETWYHANSRQPPKPMSVNF